MLPVKSSDKFTCLSSLVSVRADCNNETGTDHYIEDIEGLNIAKLARVANIQNPSGRNLGADLINRGARAMMGDIELLIANGYSLTDAFGVLCSICNFNTNYVPGGGVKVFNAISTRYGIIKISKVEVLANFTGLTNFVIDDGVTPVMYPINLVSGAIATGNIAYETNQKTVRVYMQDNTIPMGMINCPTSSDCGCGSRGSRSAVQPIRYSGIVGSVDTPSQYGFKICATVSCSYEYLLCDLVKQTPNIFALTLLYKIGQIYYIEADLSERNNRTAGGDEERKRDMAAYYQKNYNTRLQGTKETKGIRQIISTYLGRINDKCVLCDGLTKIAYATG